MRHDDDPDLRRSGGKVVIGGLLEPERHVGTRQEIFGEEGEIQTRKLLLKLCRQGHAGVEPRPDGGQDSQRPAFFDAHLHDLEISRRILLLGRFCGTVVVHDHRVFLKAW